MHCAFNGSKAKPRVTLSTRYTFPSITGTCTRKRSLLPVCATYRSRVPCRRPLGQRWHFRIDRSQSHACSWGGAQYEPALRARYMERARYIHMMSVSSSRVTRSPGSSGVLIFLRVHIPWVFSWQYSGYSKLRAPGLRAFGSYERLNRLVTPVLKA